MDDNKNKKQKISFSIWNENGDCILPFEIELIIFEYGEYLDKLNCRIICQRWKNIIENLTLWKVPMNVYKIDKIITRYLNPFEIYMYSQNMYGDIYSKYVKEKDIISYIREKNSNNEFEINWFNQPIEKISFVIQKNNRELQSSKSTLIMDEDGIPFCGINVRSTIVAEIDKDMKRNNKRSTFYCKNNNSYYISSYNGLGFFVAVPRNLLLNDDFDASKLFFHSNCSDLIWQHKFRNIYFCMDEKSKLVFKYYNGNLMKNSLSMYWIFKFKIGKPSFDNLNLCLKVLRQRPHIWKILIQYKEYFELVNGIKDYIEKMKQFKILFELVPFEREFLLPKEDILIKDESPKLLVEDNYIDRYLKFSLTENSLLENLSGYYLFPIFKYLKIEDLLNLRLVSKCLKFKVEILNLWGINGFNESFSLFFDSPEERHIIMENDGDFEIVNICSTCIDVSSVSCFHKHIPFQLTCDVFDDPTLLYYKVNDQNSDVIVFPLSSCRNNIIPLLYHLKHKIPLIGINITESFAIHIKNNLKNGKILHEIFGKSFERFSFNHLADNIQDRCFYFFYYLNIKGELCLMSNEYIWDKNKNPFKVKMEFINSYYRTAQLSNQLETIKSIFSRKGLFDYLSSNHVNELKKIYSSCLKNLKVLDFI